MAEADPHILGAAFTGSLALGEGDRWSDIDLVLAVQGSPVSTADAWATRLHAPFGVAHHWDLPTTDHRVIRVFLMLDGMEVDLSFVPEDDFGARGPQWKTLFGDQSSTFPILSTKSLLGHCLGGAGTLEAIACVKTIHTGTIHPTINCETPDPECDLDYVPNVARQADVRVTLSNSFGLGGNNACVVLGQYQNGHH